MGNSSEFLGRFKSGFKARFSRVFALGLLLAIVGASAIVSGVNPTQVYTACALKQTTKGFPQGLLYYTAQGDTPAKPCGAVGVPVSFNADVDTTLDQAGIEAFGFVTGPHTVDTNAGTICAPAEYLDGDGSCQPVPAGGGDDGDWTISGSDIYSAVSGNVGIGTTSPGAKLDVQMTGSGVGGAATIGASGNTASGDYAVAMGGGSLASGNFSTAMGLSTWASGQASTAMGYGTVASDYYSTAMGQQAIASGYVSTAMGFATVAGGDFSTAMGDRSNASGDWSTAMGYQTDASGLWSTAMGFQTDASGRASTAMGYDTVASGRYSTAMGRDTHASGDRSTAMGYRTNASGIYSTAMGRGIKAAGFYSFAIALNDQTGTTVTQDNTMAIMGGNVGIGTVSPSATLDVVGNTELNGNVDINSDLDVDGGTMHVAGGTNRVGIGTTNPAYKLDVRGNRIQLKEDGTGDSIALRTDGGGLDLEFAGGPLYVQSTTDGNHILLNPNRNSNVAIGRTGPQSALHVSGYTQIDVLTSAPPAADCDAESEAGRMKFHKTTDILYICSGYICSGLSGWVSK
jgi:hypothetical protein